MCVCVRVYVCQGAIMNSCLALVRFLSLITVSGRQHQVSASSPTFCTHTHTHTHTHTRLRPQYTSFPVRCDQYRLLSIRHTNTYTHNKRIHTHTHLIKLFLYVFVCEASKESLRTGHVNDGVLLKTRQLLWTHTHTHTQGKT